MKKISEKIKSVRGSKTMDQFASLLGKFHKTQISSYELGKVKPTTDFYKALAEKENINLNWLIADQGEMYFTGSSYNELIKENKELKDTIKKIDAALGNQIQLLADLTKQQLKKK